MFLPKTGRHYKKKEDGRSNIYDTKQPTMTKHHLYRCYNNDKKKAPSANTIVGSSPFDLIGKKEPDQTKSLGYVLARSEAIMERFLDVIRKKTHVTNPVFKHFRISEFIKDDYYVDCELLLGTEESTKYRADIVIHFPHNNFVIVIEAKSLNATTAAKDAARQGAGYAARLAENCLVVSLTNQKEFSTGDYTCIQWSDVVDLFDTIIRKNKNRDVSLEQDFLNYILKINGVMKYYDCEVLSIPAGKTIKAVEEFGIYECDWGTNKRGEHKPLFIAFRGKKGRVKTLYKIDDVLSMHLKGDLYESDLNSLSPDIKERIVNYKKEIIVGGKDFKWVFIINKHESIELLNQVMYRCSPRGDEKNRPLSAYFAEPSEDGFVWFEKL